MNPQRMKKLDLMCFLIVGVCACLESIVLILFNLGWMKVRTIELVGLLDESVKNEKPMLMICS